jgi:hypothetical protein
MTREDFVNVKLTAKGEEIAQGCLRLTGGIYEFCFKPGDVQTVTRLEWENILSRERVDDQALFELAPPPPPQPTLPPPEASARPRAKKE